MQRHRTWKNLVDQPLVRAELFVNIEALTRRGTNMVGYPGIGTFLAEARSSIDALLHEAYSLDHEPSEYENTYRAMRYAVFAGGGGKRIRSSVAIAGCIACNGKRERALPYARAIEEIHSYTLIIDDIQDKDDFRRGELACHKKFDVDTALLAALRLYERGLQVYHRLNKRHLSEVRDLLDNLHRGQCADLKSAEWDANRISADSLNFIISGKTSALFQLALLGGAAAARANERQTSSLLEYGYYLGLAYQARDDIIDELEGNKTKSNSKRNSRQLTFISIFRDKEAARREARKIVRKGIECLNKEFANRADLLRELIRVALEREY